MEGAQVPQSLLTLSLTIIAQVCWNFLSAAEYRELNLNYLKFPHT